MRFGSTSLRLAGVLAKGLRRPKFRTDLRIVEQVIAGQTRHVFSIPDAIGYGQVSPFELALLRLCDGHRTPAELADALNEIYPDRPVTGQEVADYVDSVHPSFWERGAGEKNLAILEKIRDERKQRVDRSNLAQRKLAAWSPTRVLNAIHPYLRWMYTREFVFACLVLFAVTFGLIAADWTRVRQDTLEFYTFTNKSWYDIWIFWFLLFFVSGVHEFGHGLTCKHFGGEVPAMGFMLVYFTPAFYTDVSDMYLFDRREKRLWTIFAGIWIELVLCCVATWAWFFLPPGSFLGDLSYKILLMTGVSGVFFNLNPLMKWDGYYALSQYLEIENLFDEAYNYLGQWVRRNPYGTAALAAVVLVVIWFLPPQMGISRYLAGAGAGLLLSQTPFMRLFPERLEVDLPVVSRRRARIYFFYAVASLTYITVVMIIIAGFLLNVFTAKFDIWGYPLTGYVMYVLLKKRLKGLVPLAQGGWQKLKEAYAVWQMTRKQMVGGALAAAVLLAPLPSGLRPPAVSGEFTLEPVQRADVRAVVPGRVAQIPVTGGETVAGGTILAVLRNPEIESALAAAEYERNRAERDMLAARARGDLGEVERRAQERQRAAAEAAELRRQQEALTLRAPFAGVVTTPQLSQRVGEDLQEGDLFTALADRSRMRARILVRDWELEDVKPGARVKLNLRAYPLRSYTGTIQEILPAAAADRPISDPKTLERKGQVLTNYFAVVMEVENPDGRLQEGMTGTAKIYGGGAPLAVRAVRAVGRWVASVQFFW